MLLESHVTWQGSVEPVASCSAETCLQRRVVVFTLVSVQRLEGDIPIPPGSGVRSLGPTQAA